MSGDRVACPLCGAVQTDLWEHDFGSREEVTASCGTCGADYEEANGVVAPEPKRG